MLIELAALAYCADKSNKMDAQALAKRSKAFTKEAEARDLVYQKRSTAEKKMQNVAKKKRAITHCFVGEGFRIPSCGRFGCLLLQAYCRHGRQAGGHVK